MAKKNSLPRNWIVLASFERKNNLGKGKVMRSDKDNEKHSRAFQKRQWKKEINDRGDSLAPFFMRCAA